MSCWVGLKIAGRLLGAILTDLALQKLVGVVEDVEIFRTSNFCWRDHQLAIIRVCEH